MPAAVGLDPFRAIGRRRRQRQLEDRDRLLVAVTAADRDDLVACGEATFATVTVIPSTVDWNGSARPSSIIVNRPVICSGSL